MSAPEFGEALPVTATPEVLAFLERRRSASAQTLTAPGPDAATLDRLLTLAARVPDHGKLAPWRFIVLDGEPKRAFAAAAERIAVARPDADKAGASLVKLRNPPTSVVVVSRAAPGGKIPVWEQELSAGAVCATLLYAAHAAGFGANWITDWYSDDAGTLTLLGIGEGERVAGFIHIGTPTDAPLERVRPELAAVATRWSPPVE